MKKDCPKYVAWHVKKTGCYLDLVDTFIASTFKWNLTSTSSLDKSGYFCGFGNGKISISLDSNVIDTGILKLLLPVVKSCMLVIWFKYRKLNDNSALSCHERLDHISKKIFQRLMSDEILDSFDLTNYEKINKYKKVKCQQKYGGLRTNTYIHTYIYGPFPTNAWNSQQYLITFINDYSRFGYSYLIRDKFWDVFRFYKAKVKLQLGFQILTVVDNTTVDMMDQEYSIIPQYTMPGKPIMNGFVERQNITLLDMMRRNAKFLKDVEFGREGLRNVNLDEVVTEEEDFVSLPNVVIETVQGHVSDTL
ncbi:hypothetical protein V2J09_006473 [Rumex salicifolius]